MLIGPCATPVSVMRATSAPKKRRRDEKPTRAEVERTDEPSAARVRKARAQSGQRLRARGAESRGARTRQEEQRRDLADEAVAPVEELEQSAEVLVRSEREW